VTGLRAGKKANADSLLEGQIKEGFVRIKEGFVRRWALGFAQNLVEKGRRREQARAAGTSLLQTQGFLRYASR
jgi:hypothetical protein